MTTRLRPAAVLACLLLAEVSPASAQADLQLWGNLTFDWVRSPQLVYELDFEPKVLLAAPEGAPGWRNLDLTPNVEYAYKPWLDLVGEATVGRTTQTDAVSSVEISPRVGVRFHLFSRHVPTPAFAAFFRYSEMLPKRRVVIRDLVRFESRNLFYSGGEQESSFTARLRNRLELVVLLGKGRDQLTDDGAKYFLTDWEWFVPLGTAEERFANKQRIRMGWGWRRSFAWRYELVYLWTRSRNTLEEGFSTNDNAIDIRIKRVF